jgi:hypothetical protein
MLLAQLAPLHDAAPSSEAVFFYLFGGCVLFCLTVVVMVGTIMNWGRRKPAIEAEFPTKAEMHQQMEQLRKEVRLSDTRNEELFKSVFFDLKAISNKFHSEISVLTNTVNQGFTEIQRALGRLEGRK